MRKKLIAVLLGIIVVALGVVLVGNGAFGWNINIFIEGWWAILLMLLFLIGIINDGPNLVNVIGLVLFGVLFARYHVPVLKDVNVWLIIGGAIILCVGVRIIYRAFSPKRYTSVGPATVTTDGEEGESTQKPESQSCAFSEGESSYAGKTFSGGRYTCSFGSYRIDLRGATITKGALLEVNSSFGKIDIVVPEGVTVKLAKDSVFGSVNCKAPIADNADVVIKADCAFGAVNISVE